MTPTLDILLLDSSHGTPGAAEVLWDYCLEQNIAMPTDCPSKTLRDRHKSYTHREVSITRVELTFSSRSKIGRSGKIGFTHSRSDQHSYFSASHLYEYTWGSRR